MKPWDGIIPRRTSRKPTGRPASAAAPASGQRPALLIIDVQYRTVGTEPRPFFEAIKEFPTACGQVGWDAVHHIARVLALFRAKGWPVLYPYVSPKETFDKGPARRQGAGADDGREARLRLRRPGGAARPNDVLLPKKHPSAFFGTPLASYLIERGVDTLVVTGCTTSGCVRGTVVDGFAYNFRVRCRTSACTTAARCRTPSTCSTCRRNTPT